MLSSFRQFWRISALSKSFLWSNWLFSQSEHQKPFCCHLWLVFFIRVWFPWSFICKYFSYVMQYNKIFRYQLSTTNFHFYWKEQRIANSRQFFLSTRYIYIWIIDSQTSGHLWKNKTQLLCQKMEVFFSYLYKHASKRSLQSYLNATECNIAPKHWLMFDVINLSTCSSRCRLGSCKNQWASVLTIHNWNFHRSLHQINRYYWIPDTKGYCLILRHLTSIANNFI